MFYKRQSEGMEYAKVMDEDRSTLLAKGELILDTERFVRDWNWPPFRVIRFFRRLNEDGMIHIRDEEKSRIVHVSHYEYLV